MSDWPEQCHVATSVAAREAARCILLARPVVSTKTRDLFTRKKRGNQFWPGT